MGCYQFWRHFKVQGLTAGLGALLVASIPVVFEHGTIGYANLPFTTYLILGCFMTIKGVSDQEPGVQVVGGILFGLACWTRPEGLFLAPILVIALFLGFRLSYPRYTRLSFWLPPIILMGGTWLIFLSLYSGTSTLSLGMQRSLDAMLLGQFPWGVIPRILRAFIRHALTSGIWGALFPASVILSVANIKKLAPNRYPAIFSLTAPLIASGISMGLFFVIVSFVGELNMWIETGMDRMFLPFGLLLAAWMILVVGFPKLGDAKQRQFTKAPP